MNAPADRAACCLARGAPLARVCGGTRSRGSRRTVPALHPQSRPRPSGTRVTSVGVSWRLSPLSGVPSRPTAPCHLLCCVAAPLGSCTSGGGVRVPAKGPYGSERGRTGAVPGVKRGGRQGGEGVVASAPLSNMVEQPGPMLPQEETPSLRRRRDPLDLPTPADLSLVLCRLRDELPSFFDGHHSYSLYCKDLVFQSNLLPLRVQLNSVRGYWLLVCVSRWVSLALLSCPRLELLKITKDVDEGCVRARWRLVGRPRLLPFADRWALVDAVSTFDVNACGLICRHQIDQVVPSKETQILANWLPQS